jgi:hypothetical protein
MAKQVKALPNAWVEQILIFACLKGCVEAATLSARFAKHPWKKTIVNYQPRVSLPGMRL